MVGAAVRHVVCERLGKRYVIDVEEGLCRVAVHESGQRLALLSSDGPEPSDLDVEVMLGPALVLALALRGTFCLHAGGVLADGIGAAFFGPSGAGKSTLARSDPGSPEWKRVCDDVLPFAISAGEAEMLPHFPQLKLRPEDQYGAEQPERVAVRSLYFIGEPAATGVEIRPVGLREAVLFLVRYTVASRLFDAELTQRHLSFCEELARRVPLKELRYPRRLEHLPEVRRVVKADLKA